MTKVGCCGFPHRLSEYVTAFPVVEVQQTFYRLPQVKTVVRWRAAAPPGFEFTMKAWQLITHPATSPTYRRLGREIPKKLRPRYGYFAPTEEVMEAWRTTFAVARALGIAILVFQCPASFTPTCEHVDTGGIPALFHYRDALGVPRKLVPVGARPPEATLL